MNRYLEINQLLQLHCHTNNSHIALTIILVLFTIVLVLPVSPIIHIVEYRNLFWVSYWYLLFVPFTSMFKLNGKMKN